MSIVDNPQWAGFDERNIDFKTAEVPLHRALLEPLAALREKALEAGFELGLASGYRSFERQLQIWNDKVEGRRPVFDEQGQQLDIGACDEEALMFAILRWSALPGASRHHWGTDVDVFDLGPTRRTGYRLQLTLEETEDHGVYSEFHRWLGTELASAELGFFRPYTRPVGGVAPEPWHLSYAPVAREYQRSLRKDELYQVIVQSALLLRAPVLARFDEIFERFVWVEWEYYPPAWRP